MNITSGSITIDIPSKANLRLAKHIGKDVLTSRQMKDFIAGCLVLMFDPAAEIIKIANGGDIPKVTKLDQELEGWEVFGKCWTEED